MIKGQYIVRKFKNDVYYLNLNKCNDIGYREPDNYGRLIKFEKKTNQKINYFVIHITDNCNMLCEYCFEKNVVKKQEMSIDTINNIIDFINNSEDVSDCINIRFFGGEPLLKIDFIKKAMMLLSNKILNKELKFNIFTNGSIYNEKIDFLMENYDVVLFVSIDGGIESSKNRLFKTGDPSIGVVEKNLKILLAKYPKRIVTRTVINLKNINAIFEDLEFITSLGASQISFTLPWGNLEYCSEFDQKEILKNIDQFFEEYLNKIINHDFSWMGIHPISTILYALLNGDNLIDDRSCGVGKELLSIGTDGKVYPCHSFIYNKDFEIGNVDENKVNLKNILGDTTCNDIRECDSCDIKYCCVSRCYADNYMSNGDIFKGVTYKCNIRKYIFDSICSIAIKINKMTKEKRLLNIIKNKYQLKDYA